MSDTILTVVRHGVTAWNLGRRAQGHAPVPLTDQGHEQARLLGQYMANGVQPSHPIDVIYCSDLLRCRQTAAPIAAALDLPVTYDRALREIDLGNWQGLTFDEWRQYDADNLERLMADSVNVPYPGGESRADLSRRVVTGVARILDQHPGKHVLLVTHGGSYRALLRQYGLWDHPPFSRESPSVRNTARTVLRVDGVDHLLEPLLMLDTAHLPPAMVT
jgi:broad specificity phosphatase PhoE